MIAVVQRVSSASVEVEAEEVARIDNGLLLLVGVKKNDGLQEIDYLKRKISGLRIFSDDQGKMNLSITDPGVNGEILAVSQFTLLGDVRKGRRPSFDHAEKPEKAEALFNDFVQALSAEGLSVQSGIFGAMMNVSLVNDGPVTIIVNSEDM